MPVSPVNSTNSSSSAAAQLQAQLPQQTLTQEDFLQLLVAQLSQQDPLNPVSDTDFAAQMAQFSALEESQEMEQNMASIQANGMLGQTVQLQTAQGALASGVVTGVVYQAGVPSVVVNGQSYPLNQIVSVSETPAQTGATPQP